MLKFIQHRNTIVCDVKNILNSNAQNYFENIKYSNGCSYSAMCVSINVIMYTISAGKQAANAAQIGNSFPSDPVSGMIHPRVSGSLGVRPSGTFNFSVYVCGMK